jgi:dTDP-4-amino-4,6-dideoxygalactose transaminase
MMGGKHHTSGGQGGMVLGDDAALVLEAKRFADRGKSFVPGDRSNLFLGLNYRMTELEACVGRVQLARLAGMVRTRRHRVDVFRRAIRGLRTVVLMECPYGRPSHWFVRIAIREDRISCSRDEFAAKLVETGLPVMPTYTALIYRQKWLRDRATFGAAGLPWSLSRKKYDYEGSCPNAEQAIRNQMIMLCHEDMSCDTMRRCAGLFQDVESRYGR